MPQSQKLFQPITIGDIALKHRVVLSPMTRFRNTSQHVPTDLSVEYYSQRGSVPGTLLISEATAIAAKAGGYENIPHLETPVQIAGWNKASHPFISMLWAFGRTADPAFMKRHGLQYVSASDIPLTGFPEPHVLTIEETKEYVQLFARAAVNAVEAGFDGVEVHGANGYLVDQFLQDVCNNRTDEYGGSIENRCRFALEILDAIVNALGTEQKVAIRLSPWEIYQDMRMKDPMPTFRYLVSEIARRYPNLAYLHVTEPRVTGDHDREAGEGEQNDFIREIWGSRAFVSAGGYNRELAVDTAERTGNLIAFGRHYLANPDLPLRLYANHPLNKYNRKTFLLVENSIGYTDYPFAEDLRSRAIESDKANASD
ncbi:hypothetical protein NLI96_g4051 [Meripilus lineatus]|uniref:NADH:flavin oxidoreductase/NADH oxidase N-terminal domain-containing protein n=1 Tax=Meripilus lineatus TaxID=2056292 RepID=A0AAD5V7N5_9APHY|nr:hypothetical protein NLI96_g4051 [Physisporinus lineatus]